MPIWKASIPPFCQPGSAGRGTRTRAPAWRFRNTRRLGTSLAEYRLDQSPSAFRFVYEEVHRVRRPEGGTLPSSSDLGGFSALLGDAIREPRGVAEGLCPVDPTPEALAPALRALAKRAQQMSGVPCGFVTAGDVLVPDATIAQHLYRIAQEALSKAVRHARASRISVELRGSDEALFLRAEDDGVGPPGTPPSGGLGLRSMAFRARAVEGEFAVHPAPDGGTRVSCRVPRAACTPPNKREVYRLMGLGEGTCDVAAAMQISTHTVEPYYARNPSRSWVSMGCANSGTTPSTTSTGTGPDAPATVRTVTGGLCTPQSPPGPQRPRISLGRYLVNN